MPKRKRPSDVLDKLMKDIERQVRNYRKLASTVYSIPVGELTTEDRKEKHKLMCRAVGTLLNVCVHSRDEIARYIAVLRDEDLALEESIEMKRLILRAVENLHFVSQAFCEDLPIH